MSLINEALKKAQRMRHQDPGGPAASPEAATSLAPAPSQPLRRGQTPSSQKLLLALGVPLLVLVSVGATWWLLRPIEPSTPAVAQTPAPAAAPSSAIAPIASAPTAAPASAESTPIVSLPVSTPATPTSEAPAVAQVAVPPAPVATDEPVTAPVTKLAVSEAPALPQSPRPDPRVHAFLDTLRVTGIRSSTTDPRVSMNDRVFRLNDIVDRNLELRIVGIAPEGLTFIDPNGVVYQTQF